MAVKDRQIVSSAADAVLIVNIFIAGSSMIDVNDV